MTSYTSWRRWLNRLRTKVRKTQLLRTFVRNLFDHLRQLVYDVIWHEYSDYEQRQSPTLQRDQVVEAVGDALYVAPSIETADYHQFSEGRTYLYSFNYQSRVSGYPDWAGE